jgi:hypothetical protein
MATPKSRPSGPPARTASRPDAIANGYEGGREAPYSPVTDENARGTPAVVEARRRADGSKTESEAHASTGHRPTVDAPKAPEITRGKVVGARKGQPRR